MEQIGRLSDLVERLLDVSRIVSGKVEMNLAQTNLSEVVRRVAADCRETARAAGADLRVQADGDVIGRWDGARLEQVVMNLLSNALKYGGGKPVDLEVDGTDTVARVIVRDRGIGISAEDIDRIFTRFERAAPVRHYGGLGLGLYIAKNIVELHRGSIRVTSSEGQGSTFVVELPRRATTQRGARSGEPESSHERPPGATASDGRRGRRRHPRSSWSSRDTSTSRSVPPTAGGDRRLRALHDRPCVILLDLMMPVMDGREFRALLLQDAELGAIPVVILTAHANLRDAAEGMAAAACLKKPVQLDVLLQIIHQFCRPSAAA